MRLHAAGDVPGVRADDADPHRQPAVVGAVGAGRGGRSASQSLCSMCQSAGCSAMRAAKASASAWVAARHPVAQRGRPDSSIGGLMRCPQPSSSVNQSADRQQRGAGRGGQQRRAGRHPGRLAEELHLDAVRGQVAVGDQADHPAGPQPLGQDLESAAAAPPVSGSTSMPRLSR